MLKIVNIFVQKYFIIIYLQTIYDGVIDAELDHEHKLLIAKENPNEYQSINPIEQFQKRTDFCNDVHSEAVKVYLNICYQSMRYSLTTYKELDKEDENDKDEDTDESDYELDYFDDVF